MALVNPSHGIILPFVFFFSIPLAVLATITTSIAFWVLTFRVALLYIELGFSTIPSYLVTTKHDAIAITPNRSFSSPNTGSRRRKRRGSTSSNVSGAGSITPIATDTNIGWIQTVGPNRDYEGVGGWRLGNSLEDDGLWTSINSRLELPADHGRRHRRSLTGPISPIEIKHGRSYSHSPNTSRARTPPAYAAVVGDGYFGQQLGLNRIPKQPSMAMSTASLSSGSSSKSSGSLSIKKKPKDLGLR
ncbi:hypothetical protein F5884DRAFT_797106 [Xylogone sp. PMI_703]|nr:hypothetical protein F5884DRAFT_797106 [Xylogone sp. PMI_703]